jgi:hypothetical protein
MNYAFSSAFTVSPDSVPQPHVIQNDDDNEIDEVMGPRGAHCTASTSTAGRLRDGYFGQI